MSKYFTYLLTLIGFLSVSCSSSTKTQDESQPNSRNYANTTYESEENPIESSTSDTEDELDNNDEEMSDNVNVNELDFLTRMAYTGSTPSETEQATLDSLANVFINEDTPKSKYLITNNSAGYFKMNGTVKDINDKYYKLKYYVGSINMVDAANVAGCFLDKIEADNKSDEIDGCSMPYADDNTIIAFGGKYFMPYEEDNPKNKEYEKDNSIYLILCENTSSWHRKDSIDNIVIRSDKFKTKEGIGVGSTFEELQNTYGDLYLHIGWIEDEERVEVRTAKYPMVRFIFQEEDVLNFCSNKNSNDDEQCEEGEDCNERCREDGFIGSRKEDGSGLKPNSKIWRIIINRYYVTCPECL